MLRRSKSRKRQKGESSSAGNQGGHLEAWFNGDIGKMNTFISEFSQKGIVIPKFIKFRWLDEEGFTSLRRKLKSQKLKTFMEFTGNIQPDLVRVFYSNLTVNGSTIRSQVKGVNIEITPAVWEQVAGLKDRGVKVSRGNISEIPEFNKIQFFRSCLKDPDDSVRILNAGKLALEHRLLAFIVAWMLTPRGSNHAILNEGDLALMYCIFNSIKVNWVYVIKDHMLKAKRLADFKLPYAMLINNFFRFFEVDLSGESIETPKASNEIDDSTLRKMGYIKVDDEWISKVDAGMSEAEEEDEDEEQGQIPSSPAAAEVPGSSSGQASYENMEIIPFVEQPDRGTPLSQFERSMLSQMATMQENQRRHMQMTYQHFQQTNLQFESLGHQIADIYTKLEDMQLNQGNWDD